MPDLVSATGEDPTTTVPGNKKAREESFTRLVTLLKKM